MGENARIVNVHITFRNTEATEALKGYATEKITNTLKKFVHHDTEAHVVLKVEKNRQIAEVSFRSDGADFHAKEESSDLYSSIDTLVDSLTQQLRKHKDKITDHH
ncbi:MAG: ribosome-associated translation inhibitor RaiA [Deltaproteobacteria bacterium]|nr:ribosome-associated translation inhibitor RaiA [Deltaproteobacteria bacterium]